MAAHPYTLLDVFCERPLEGNGLAVVHDADALDDRVMAALARETRLSETSFIQTPTLSGADYRHRIWTPTGELPFAGHPSLGVAVAVARRARAARAGYVQQTGAGLQPVEVELIGDGTAARASMVQQPASFGAQLDAAPVLAAVGLPGAAAHPDLPPQVVSTGVPQLIAVLRERDALAQLSPDWGRIRGLLGPHRAVCLYLAWCDPERGLARARSLTPAVALATLGGPGGGEDPATGSAAGPLCAYLGQGTGLVGLVVEQGVEMGRPSRLECAVEAPPCSGEGARVRVGGGVRVLVEGTLHLELADDQM